MEAAVVVDTTEEEESSEDQSRTKAAPPAGCCPGPAWQRDQVAAFSEVRLGAARHAQLGRDTGEVGTYLVCDRR